MEGENKLVLEIDAINKVNYCLVHNGIKIISSIKLINESDKIYRNLIVKVRFEPTFADGYTFEISFIDKNQSIIERNINLPINFDYLYSLNESFKANLICEVCDGENIIASVIKPLEVLTFDQWDGSQVATQYLASFVLPNDNVVKKILKNAEEILTSESTLKCFSGYIDGDKNLVIKEVGAIYYALLKENISYALPKPSFELNGQKIRLPLEIINSKFATCLDSTLLYSAILELAGLNSLIILIDGHAYLGVWLDDENYPSVLIEDKAYIENKVKNNEIILIETTLITSKASPSFEEAINAGKHNLNTKTKTFYAIDLRSARASQIKPLPISSDETGKYILVDEKDLDIKPDLNYSVEDVRIIDNKINKDRFDVWEKKLLDLTNRNKLVSFVPGNQHFQFFAYDIYRFFGALLHENLLVLSEKMEVYKEVVDKIFDVNFSQNKTIFDNDIENERVRLLVTEKKLPTILRNLQSNAKSSIEESGSNTLFVTFGTLSYKEKGKVRYAPLILVPVDITKNSTGRNYSLSARDDEILVNNTLFEYLKVNFDLHFDELRKIPYDEENDTYDLKSYFDTLRSKITGLEGWTVSETAFIGIFSFTRFIMWNDLRNRKEDLLKNDIVKSLVDNSIPFKNKNQPVNINDLDLILAPNKYAIPLMADSSQTEAIVDASRGLSFVLNGPPGTGKSQTITNMIINSLYNKKTVLFVAQKMAALEVVKKRLDETGLGLFCLELHSNKAQKADVLSQIKRILDTGKLKKPEEYDVICARLLEKRNELNNDIKKLHKNSTNGFDLYENITCYEEYKDYYKNIKLQGIDYSLINRDIYLATLKEIETFINFKKELGDKYIKLFSPIKLEEYSISLRTDFKETLDQYSVSIFNYSSYLQNVLQSTNTTLALNYSNLYNLYLAVTFYNSKKNNIYKELVLSNDEKEKSILKGLVSKLGEFKSTNDLINTSFNRSVLTLPFDNLLFRYDRSLNLSFFSKQKEQKAILNELKRYALLPKSLNKGGLYKLLDDLNKFSKFYKGLKDNENSLKHYFKDDYKEFDTDYSLVLSNIETSLEFKKVFDSFDASDKFKLLDEISNNSFDRYRIIAENSNSIEDKLNTKFKLSIKSLGFTNFFAETNKFIESLKENLEKLKEYVLFNEEKNKLNKLPVGNLVKLILEGFVKDDDAINFYKKDINYNLAMLRINNDKDLNLFSGAKENDTIESYRKLINEYNEVTIKEVAARLSKSTSQFFNSENSSLSSEFVILNKAISNNGRGISLRNLFDSIPNILHLICPCFLMSPLSVAQYLDPKNEPFDIVIFDEASQITTSDAIGAIARGKSAVIVGDEKQLPPTSFFQANTSDEDDFFIEDGESVLSDCLNISMPKKYLSWHYRSKDESLIAFSNASYYDNRLLTFPSPENIEGAITYNYISDGVYENRRNKREAEEIIKEVTRRLKDPILSKKSIGIVTFSIAQQSLIEEKFQEALRKDRDLENAVSSQKEELFIKNLENVQGDERDVIIFSICYGPGKDGKVTLNFGPLSTNGGEKRLNVAVSRAREEMLIYTSLRSDMIDLSRAQNSGSRGLKEFLEYARRGKSYILIKNGEQKEYKEGIEKYIARDLEARGYKCNINVGTSDFRVDIGVISNEDPNKYSLGILCDSKSYIESKTAKDRNVTQKAVLNRLGWKIIRIWSLDYFDSPNYVIDKIVEAINNPHFDESQNDARIPHISFEKSDEVVSMNHAIDYVSTGYIKKSDDSDNFFMFLGEVKNVCNFFIKNEAPISYRLLVKKVLDHYNISKNSARTREVFYKVLNGYKVTYTGDVPFYWSDELQYLSLSKYRVGGEREFIDIPKEELLIAISDIMKKKLSLNEVELTKELTNCFGFTKVGDTIKNVVDIAIQYALEKKVIREENGAYYYIAPTRVER